MFIGFLLMIAFFAGCGQKGIYDVNEPIDPALQEQKASDIDPLVEGEIDNSVVDDKNIDIGTPY